MIGLNRAQQLTLFRLRARLLWRQFTGEKGRIVTALVVLSIFVPLVLGLAVGSAIGYLRLPDFWPAQLLGGVLVLLWLVWALAPILLGAINVSIDVSRLLIYPLSRRDMAAAVLLGTLLDYPTFLILPLFAAVVVGWIWTPAWPFVVLGLPIAYLHMVIIGQIIMVGAGHILQSRRFRDLTVIVVSVLGASCYFFVEAFTSLVKTFVEPAAAEAFFATWRPLNLLQWLPTGAIARAIELGAQGRWGQAVTWLGYALLLLAVLARVWLALLERLITGRGFLVGRPEPREEKKNQTRPEAAVRLGFLPEPLRTMMIKEWILTWRIPQRRIGLIQAFILPIIFAGFYFFSGEFESEAFFERANRWTGLFLVGYSYLPTLGFATNSLAWEGKGLSILFLTPTDRRLIMRAKTITSIVLAAASLFIFTPILLFFSAPWPLLTGFFAAIGLIGVGTAVGMLFSVWFPFPVNTDPKRPFAQPARRGGFWPTIMNVFGTPLLTGLLAVPLALPIALVWWFEQDVIGFGLSVLAAAYGLAVAWWMCGPAARELLQREPEILDALRAPEGE